MSDIDWDEIIEEEEFFEDMEMLEEQERERQSGRQSKQQSERQSGRQETPESGEPYTVTTTKKKKRRAPGCLIALAVFFGVLLLGLLLSRVG